MSERTTVGEILKWIEDGGLTPDTTVTLDGDGTLMADIPGTIGFTYLHIGFVETDELEEYVDDREPIDGLPGQTGDVVFWYDRRPWWIVEWQPDNGPVYAIVDANGGIGLAGADELTRDFRAAQKREKANKKGAK